MQSNKTIQDDIATRKQLLEQSGKLMQMLTLHKSRYDRQDMKQNRLTGGGHTFFIDQ